MTETAPSCAPTMSDIRDKQFRTTKVCAQATSANHWPQRAWPMLGVCFFIYRFPFPTRSPFFFPPSSDVTKSRPP
jgi:hypothetical protein